MATVGVKVLILRFPIINIVYMNCSSERCSNTLEFVRVINKPNNTKLSSFRNDI